jgi:long-chain acyl-CoA synthetase
MTLATLLNAAARRHPDRPSVMVGARPYLDYAALARVSRSLGDAMRSNFGLGRGDRVLLSMTNNPDYLTVLFACWQAGLTAVPVNARLHAREIAYIARDCGARVGFATADIAGAVSNEVADLPLVEVGTAEFAQLLARHPGSTAADTLASDTAWIFYTSGTTGRPKGALLSHRNLMAMVLSYLADIDPLSSRDSLLHLAATSHASGLFGLSFIAKAAANVLPEAPGYDADEFARLVRAAEAMTFFAPSTLLNRMTADGLADIPLDRLRTVLTGAGPIYVDDLRRWLAAFGPRVWNGYGQGETPCTITAISKAEMWEAFLRDDVGLLGSVGFARTGTEVRIAGPAGEELPPGEVGEVLVRGETIMAGYLNLPAATAEALRGGWLHTGDLARMDALGAVTLLDRKKDMIITGGMNVYAREVEEVLIGCPEVQECAVIGVQDAEWGEAVVAVIVPRTGGADPARIDSFCLDRLARFKRPKRYVLVPELPKNTAGKVLKSELRTRYAAGAG